ncbi:MAG TPA: ABC transporter ATP-binding protein [Gemmatimonadaceae bacterium]|nr:ABC transporter ATP-binding protein [Gemmatimonadaceae bacterium]
MISVRDLTKLYGDLIAVSRLSFEVGPREVLGLVGPNGAGKTTTLRCLCGIIAPTRGRVEIAGHDIARDPVEAKRALAFIPDEPHLFDYLTVDEHLRFTARVYGVADVDARIPTLLRELELTEKRGVLPAELSRGMRQKLAIACGLIHDPSVLILDEPLTGLDPGGIRRMKDTIAARAAAGSAVVLSSHLLHLVEELCTKLLIVRKGACVEYGTPPEIIARRPELEGRTLEEVFLILTGDESMAV